MYHYVNSITNTRGDALTGFFVKAIDTTTGSAAPIYADDSATPIAAVSGVANAAQVDGDGNASFYVDSGEYHLDIYNTDATTFVKRIQNVPMVTAGDFVTPTQLADSGGAALIGADGGGTVQDALDRIGSFVGYDSGGSVTQITSKSTGVTIDAPCGQIVMHSGSLASGIIAAFLVANSSCDSTDTVIVNLQSGNANVGTYRVWAESIGSGSFVICVENRTGGDLAEALVLNFSILKGANA
jgi:hypothetical protein